MTERNTLADQIDHDACSAPRCERDAAQVPTLFRRRGSPSGDVMCWPSRERFYGSAEAAPPSPYPRCALDVCDRSAVYGGDE